jgi:hypothetical protein
MERCRGCRTSSLETGVVELEAKLVVVNARSDELGRVELSRAAACWHRLQTVLSVISDVAGH